jgi:tRNA nucleotidyltransferase (CCA-adding enzyme)
MAFCNRLKVPNEERDLAVSLGACRNYLESVPAASAPRLLELLTAGDAFRRPARFADLLAAARMAEPKLDIGRVERAAQAARGVNAAEIAKKASSGRETEKLLREARVQAIQNAT